MSIKRVHGTYRGTTEHILVSEELDLTQAEVESVARKLFVSIFQEQHKDVVIPEDVAMTYES